MIERAIAWDMDGVLADTGEAHYHAWRRMFAEEGRPLTRAQFEETFGMANPEILRRWLGEPLLDQHSLGQQSHGRKDTRHLTLATAHLVQIPDRIVLQRLPHHRRQCRPLRPPCASSHRDSSPFPRDDNEPAVTAR